MKNRTKIVSALSLAGLLSASAAFADVSTPTTPTTTTSLPPGLTLPTVTHKPTPTAPKPTKPTHISIDNNARCAGGGTRVTAGTYDTLTGDVNIVVTLTGCVDATNTTHDGTVTTTGTAKTGTTAGTYALDITYVFDTHFVNTKQDVQRQCTWQKTGTFDTNTEKFAGTITKTNCVLTLTESEPGNILEHILKKSTQSE